MHRFRNIWSIDFRVRCHGLGRVLFDSFFSRVKINMGATAKPLIRSVMPLVTRCADGTAFMPSRTDPQGMMARARFNASQKLQYTFWTNTARIFETH